jgi:alpha-tubulin suppressor-like RCC1 family protein
MTRCCHLTLVFACACGARTELSGPIAEGTSPPTTTTVVHISAGYGASCAITQAGTLKCWGLNDNGQLADGTTANSLLPVASHVTNASSVGTALGHTCAVLRDGHVTCWGDLECDFTDISNARSVFVGSAHSCVLLDTNEIRCCGRNDEGELGDGSQVASSVPVTAALAPASSVAIGWGTHTCAVLLDGHVSCWGNNDYGQLGDGTMTSRSQPVLAIGVEGAVAVGVGDNHTCAILRDGSVVCWGANQYGQLGTGSSSPSVLTAVQAAESDALSVAPGVDATCALERNGSVRCWGRATYGELGGGGPVDIDNGARSLFAVTAVDSGAIALAGGESDACVLMADGSARCWGYNFGGQLGDGSQIDRSTPTTVNGF